MKHYKRKVLFLKLLFITKDKCFKVAWIEFFFKFTIIFFFYDKYKPIKKSYKFKVFGCKKCIFSSLSVFKYCCVRNHKNISRLKLLKCAWKINLFYFFISWTPFKRDKCFVEGRSRFTLSVQNLFRLSLVVGLYRVAARLPNTKRCKPVDQPKLRTSKKLKSKRMAPQLPEQKTEGLPTLNENFEYKEAQGNAAHDAVGAQEKIEEIKNRRSRNLIKKCLWQLSSNLNVLVVGAKESGEFSL